MDDASDPVPALKQQLAQAILQRFELSGQHNMASRLGIDQPRASNLMRGRLERFSLQQLVRFAARAGGETSITVTWTSRRIWIIPRPHVHRARGFREGARTTRPAPTARSPAGETQSFPFAN